MRTPRDALFDALKALDEEGCRAALGKGADACGRGGGALTPVQMLTEMPPGAFEKDSLLSGRRARMLAMLAESGADLADVDMFFAGKGLPDDESGRLVRKAAKLGRIRRKAGWEGGLQGRGTPATEAGVMLREAAKRGDETAVEELLEISHPDTPDPDGGRTPLITAIRAGHPGVVMLLINAGADVDAVLGDRDSPLHATAGAPRGAESARMLLDAGAYPDVRTSLGLTPLFEAIKEDDAEIVTLLVSRGASLEVDEREKRYTMRTFIHSERTRKALEAGLAEKEARRERNALSELLGGGWPGEPGKEEGDETGGGKDGKTGGRRL